MSGPPSPQATPGSSGRVAAVCPYIQIPVPGRQEGGYSLPPDPLKPQSLSSPATVNHARSKSGQSFLLFLDRILLLHLVFSRTVTKTATGILEICPGINASLRKLLVLSHRKRPNKSSLW